MSVLGSISWTPLGATTPVTLTGADIETLIAAIAARRAALEVLRVALQAAVAACGTVAAVEALAVSSGWPTAS